MKLSEIIKIPSQDHGIKDFSVFDKVIRYKNSSVEKYPLLFNKVNDNFYFCFEVEGIKTAFMVVEKLTDFTDKETITVQKTYVLPKFRNKGLITALYNTLRNQGFRIVSDLHLTPESRSVWKKLITNFGAELINKNTGERFKASIQDLEKDNEEILLVMEHLGLNKPYVNNDIVEELNLFIKL